MRAADREEIFALHYDYEEDADLIYTSAILASAEKSVAWIAYNGTEPVAALGMNLLWPGVASVWMFATDGWLSVCFGLTKFAKRTIIPLLQDAEIHRAHCWSQDSHHVSHRWLERLGATHETMVPGYGKNGEAFCLFAWVKGRDF